MSDTGLRIRQAASLLHDWAAPGDAIAQWTHFVTSTCNARCQHCFYPINQKKHELTLEEIERFVRTLPPIRLLLFSGGEPFLRKDLPEIIAAYHRHCRFFTASIPTNGWSAAKITAMTERILEIDPSLHLGVTVSLDGMGPYHDQVRRLPGLWDNAIETLHALSALSERFPNLTVGVNTVYMRENQADLEPLLEYIFDQVRPTFHTLIYIRGNPLGDPSLATQLDVGRYLQLSKWLDARYGDDTRWRAGWRGVRARARHEVNRQRYEYIARQARGGGFEGFCLAGEREFVLQETGDVFGCELIEERIANIRELGYDYGRVLSAADAFVAAKRARLCKCTHECNTRTKILFDRRQALPIAAAALGLRRAPTEAT
jgi:MoaA/NifB/PqqE/SkfB family radical SAM enzyme